MYILVQIHIYGVRVCKRTGYEKKLSKEEEDDHTFKKDLQLTIFGRSFADVFKGAMRAEKPICYRLNDEI